MTTVKQHLQQHHAALEEHHRGMAKDHHAFAKAHDEETAISKLHTSLAKRHEAVADHHAEMFAECDGMGKAQDSADLNKLVPDSVRAVIPYSGVTAVPRAGQPQLPAKPNVPAQFEKLVAIEDD